MPSRGGCDSLGLCQMRARLGACDVTFRVGSGSGDESKVEELNTVKRLTCTLKICHYITIVFGLDN